MRVLGPYFLPDRQGRASADAVDDALHDAQRHGLRAAAVVLEHPDGHVYTYVSDRLSTGRRRSLLDALRQRLTTGG